jgi:NTE family protein
MRIGLALGGGGVRSASQLGMAQFLREQSIKPTVFAGTSGGSIVATLLALGYTPEKSLKLFKNTGNIKDIAYWHIISSLLKRQKIQAIFKGDRLSEALATVFDSKSIVNISMTSNYVRREERLGIISTDINTGKQIIFTNYINTNTSLINDDNHMVVNNLFYHLSTVVAASCTIPGLFMPKQLDGLLLVDGGLTNNVPSDVAFALGAEKVISIDLGYSGQVDKVDGLYEVLTHSLGILMEREVDNNSKSFGIYLNPKIYDVTVLETNKIDECFERGYQFMKDNFKAVDDYLEG